MSKDTKEEETEEEAPEVEESEEEKEQQETEATELSEETGEEEAEEETEVEAAAPTAEAAEEEEEAPGKEEIEVVEERIYTVPFRKVWITARDRRAAKATRVLRQFVMRHMKTDDVKISNEINEELWARGIQKPPRKVRIRAVKDKEGTVIIYPAAEAA